MTVLYVLTVLPGMKSGSEGTWSACRASGPWRGSGCPGRYRASPAPRCRALEQSIRQSSVHVRQSSGHIRQSSGHIIQSSGHIRQSRFRPLARFRMSWSFACIASAALPKVWGYPLTGLKNNIVLGISGILPNFASKFRLFSNLKAQILEIWPSAPESAKKN